MTKLELQVNDNVIDVINKIKNINDSGIDLVIPENSVLFDNIVNLKLIDQKAKDWEISLQFTTDDEIGNNLISMMDGKETTDFLPKELQEEFEEIEKKKARFFNLTKFFNKFNIPSINLNINKSILILPIVGIFIIGGAIFAGATLPKANINIAVNSQPLTRSLTIKVDSTADKSYDSENKILKGETIVTTVESYGDIETTGEKTIGDKAEGTIKIYNRTSDEIELDDGEEVKFKTDDGDLVFYLKDDVNIPSEHLEDETDLSSPSIPGEASVEVIAAYFGSSYNIDKDEELEFEDYKRSELAAKAEEDFEGGKSETVKVVSEEDRTNLSNKLKDSNINSATGELNKQTETKKKLIDGSVIAAISSEKFSHEVDDDTDKLSLTQTASASGLVYSEDNLNDLLDEIVKDLIPEGYRLSEQDRSLNIEVLGNSTSSVLNESEADIQVTLKAYVIPDIDIENLKTQLEKKTPQEAQKIIGSIKNIKTYEFKLAPSIPFFRKVPKNHDRIIISLKNE